MTYEEMEEKLAEQVGYVLCNYIESPTYHIVSESSTHYVLDVPFDIESSVYVDTMGFIQEGYSYKLINGVEVQKSNITGNIDSFISNVNLEDLIDQNIYQHKAEIVRQYRDQLLEESDNKMLIDRIPLESIDSGETFYQVLFEILTGPLGTYRQALRDIPNQSGFPDNVEWPELPETIFNVISND